MRQLIVSVVTPDSPTDRDVSPHGCARVSRLALRPAQLPYIRSAGQTARPSSAYSTLPPLIHAITIRQAESGPTHSGLIAYHYIINMGQKNL